MTSRVRDDAAIARSQNDRSIDEWLIRIVAADGASHSAGDARENGSAGGMRQGRLWWTRHGLQVRGPTARAEDESKDGRDPDGDAEKTRHKEQLGCNLTL